MTQMVAFCYATEPLADPSQGDYWPVLIKDAFRYNLEKLWPQPAPVIAGWIEKYRDDPNFHVRFFKVRPR